MNAFPSDIDNLIMNMFNQCVHAGINNADNIALSYLREDSVSKDHAEFLYRHFFDDHMQQFHYYHLNPGLDDLVSIIRNKINDHCADTMESAIIYHQSLVPYELVNPKHTCQTYICCELILDIPHNMTTEDDLPWTKETHHRICINAGVKPCYAAERGFSIAYDVHGYSGRANHQMARELCYDAMEYQGLRDLRFAGMNTLYMKDHMPWSVDELNRLIAALNLEYIAVKIENKKICILDE